MIWIYGIKMKYKIRDLRNNPKAKKDRDAEDLVCELGLMAMCYSGSRKVGELIKSLKHRFNFKDIKSEHTEKVRLRQMILDVPIGIEIDL